MRYLLAFLLLFSLRAFGANGDYLGSYIQTNGWILVTLWSSDGSFGTNGTHTFNFATNNVPTSSNTVVMTQQDAGFSNAAAALWTRTNYGCSKILTPATGTPYYQEFLSGTILSIHTSMSEWVCGATSNLLLYVTNGFYVQNSITNAAAFGVTVTNLSTQIYQAPDFAWLSPRWERWTNATEKVRLIASHGECEEGRPVDSVELIVKDEHSTTWTNTQTVLTQDATFPDIFRFGAYYFSVPNNTFSNLDQLRIDVVVRPKYGTNIFDTRSDVYTGITALPTSITNQCDHLNTIASVKRIAVVSLAGNNTDGRLTNTSPADIATTNYFASIRGAAVALAGTNTDLNGGFIYIRSGYSNYTGAGAGSIGAIPKSVVTILPYPGDDLGTGLTNAVSDDELTDRIRFVDIPFGPGGTFMHSGTEYIEFKGCRIDTPSTGFLLTCPIVWMHFCAITNLGQGLRANSTENTAFHVISCNLNGFNKTIRLHTFWGNLHAIPITTSLYAQSDISSSDGVSVEHTYCGNNLMLNLGDNGAGAPQFTVCPNKAITKGFTQMNDVWEICTNINGSTFNYASLVGGVSCTNIKVFNVDMHGKRVADMFSSPSGASLDWRIQCYVRNSRFGNTGWKDWNDNTTNAARVGPLSIFYGVGCSGNFYVECNTTGVESPGSFNPDFPGLYSYHPVGSGTNTCEFTGVADYRAWGSVTGIGGGSYKPLPNRAFPGYKEAMRYDLEGRLRYANTAGAYEFYPYKAIIRGHDVMR